jgi:hypothetical protein
MATLMGKTSWRQKVTTRIMGSKVRIWMTLDLWKILIKREKVVLMRAMIWRIVNRRVKLMRYMEDAGHEDDLDYMEVC